MFYNYTHCEKKVLRFIKMTMQRNLKFMVFGLNVITSVIIKIKDNNLIAKRYFRPCISLQGAARFCLSIHWSYTHSRHIL